LRHLPEPEPEDTPPVPTPPQRVAALPPPRPAEPPKPQVQPPPRPVEPPKAEAIEPPKPPERPKPEAKETPRPPDKPKVDPKNDQLAKLIDAKKPDAPKPPAARPRSADATDQQPRFDASSIAQALSREPAQQRAATGRTLSQTASIGSPTANAPRMSPSLWGQLDGYLQEQYKQCWNNLGLSPGQKYIPQIKVTFAQNGGLIGAPELLNRSSDQNMRSIAESALRAVKKCDPLRIPPQYAPYYNEWRIRILRFDPAEMAG
jgi:colicin import membrane protein